MQASSISINRKLPASKYGQKAAEPVRKYQFFLATPLSRTYPSHLLPSSGLVRIVSRISQASLTALSLSFSGRRSSICAPISLIQPSIPPSGPVVALVGRYSVSSFSTWNPRFSSASLIHVSDGKNQGTDSRAFSMGTSWRTRTPRSAAVISATLPWPPISKTKAPPGLRAECMARRVDILVDSSFRIQCRAAFETLYRTSKSLVILCSHHR